MFANIDYSKRINTHKKKESNRVIRAFSLAGNAQRTAFIPEKISFYCSALEALLSTSQAELSHQIAERVAVVVKSQQPRIETYRFMKKCYSFRSKYVHGDALSLTSSEIAKCSVELDTIVRATIEAVLSDVEFFRSIQDNNLLDEFLLKKILG